MKNWLAPVIIASLLFLGIRPAFAQVIEEQADLAQYLIANDVEVGSEVVSGFHQVYYVFEGEKTYITTGNLNATSPASAGEYVVYRRNTGAGGDNTFLYHIPAATTIQLSGSSNNANPKVARDGQVVWEGWVEDRWQVFMFDGVSVRQMTSGAMAIDPDIEGSWLVYRQKNENEGGGWRVRLYDLLTERVTDLGEGMEPELDGEELLWSVWDGEEVLRYRYNFRFGKLELSGAKFGLLTEEDVGLGKTEEPAVAEVEAAPEVVTEEEIREELEGPEPVEVEFLELELTEEATSSASLEAIEDESLIPTESGETQ